MLTEGQWDRISKHQKFSNSININKTSIWDETLDTLVCNCIFCKYKEESKIEHKLSNTSTKIQIKRCIKHKEYPLIEPIHCNYCDTEIWTLKQPIVPNFNPSCGNCKSNKLKEIFIEMSTKVDHPKEISTENDTIEENHTEEISNIEEDHRDGIFHSTKLRIKKPHQEDKSKYISNIISRSKEQAKNIRIKTISEDQENESEDDIESEEDFTDSEEDYESDYYRHNSEEEIESE